jgi:hypothetical protein
MKKILLPFLTFLLVILTGCGNSGSKSDAIAAYEYEKADEQLNEVLTQKIGNWAKTGVTCYGVVVLQDENMQSIKGLPVKAKIVRIKADGLKMKSLENITLAPKQGCSKIGMKKGETWWETDGDIFQTKKEAEQFLSSNGLLK